MDIFTIFGTNTRLVDLVVPFLNGPALLNLVSLRSDLRGLRFTAMKTLRSFRSFAVRLSGCSLRRLSPEFSRFPHLWDLNLSQNRLTSSGLKHLPISVRYLNLSDNDLSDLPNDAFTHLIHLAELSVSGAQITRLLSSHFPGSIQSINAGKNQIMDVPDDLLENLPTLSIMHLAGNPLYKLSREKLKHFHNTLLSRDGVFMIHSVNLNLFPGTLPPP